MNWVEVFEANTSVLSGESPVDGTTKPIAAFFPRGDLGDERPGVGDATVEALAPQAAQFDLGHVQPATVLRRVVQLQFCGKTMGLFGRKSLVEGAQDVGVEVVLDQHDLFGVGVVDVDQVLDGSAPSRSGCAGR